MKKNQIIILIGIQIFSATIPEDGKAIGFTMLLLICSLLYKERKEDN